MNVFAAMHRALHADRNLSVVVDYHPAGGSPPIEGLRVIPVVVDTAANLSGERAKRTTHAFTVMAADLPGETPRKGDRMLNAATLLDHVIFEFEADEMRLTLRVFCRPATPG